MAAKIRANEKVIAMLSNEELLKGNFRKRARSKIEKEMRKRGILKND